MRRVVVDGWARRQRRRGQCKRPSHCACHSRPVTTNHKRAHNRRTLICKVEEVHTTLRKHLAKEEEQLLPLLLQHFSYGEQAELVAQFLYTIPLETVERVLSVLKPMIPKVGRAGVCGGAGVNRGREAWRGVGGWGGGGGPCWQEEEGRGGGGLPQSCPAKAMTRRRSSRLYVRTFAGRAGAAAGGDPGRHP